MNHESIQFHLDEELEIIKFNMKKESKKFEILKNKILDKLQKEENNFNQKMIEFDILKNKKINESETFGKVLSSYKNEKNLENVINWRNYLNDSLNHLNLESFQLFCCGINKYGNLGIEERKISNFEEISFFKNKNILKISCSFYFTLVLCSSGLYFSGTLLGKKTNEFICMDFFKNLKITNICCGAEHALVLCKNGKVYSFGDNKHGQLGLGNFEASSTPQEVPNFTNESIKKISCGYNCSFSICGNFKIIQFCRIQSLFLGK
jgi:alpha-tubulin suppressor-like RCC1 family protein